MIGLILLQIALIALNAIFAGTEIAVISVNETKLEKEVESGNKRAGWLLKMVRNSSGFLATIQVAITLSGFLGAAFASDSFAEKLTWLLQKTGIGISESVLNTISVILVTLIISYFSIVFGEMIPKRIAMKNAERFSLTMAGPGHKKGTIDATENDIIKNVFAFDDLTVGEICTHRKEVAVLWMDETIAQWEQTIHESRHSVYPVCGDSVDQIVGVLNAKDFFRLKDRTRDFVMEHAVHTPYFIHENMKADELFSKMKRHADHFAVVVDEYGGMCGIITVTDLVEQLVGDFDDDETERQEPELERLDSRTWKIRGTCSIHDVTKALEHEFTDAEEFETFSGFLIGKLGEIPKDGSRLKLEIEGYLIRILNVRQHCVEKAIVRVADTAPAAES